MKYYYINLDRSIDRKKDMEDQFIKYNIPAERIQAVDGSKLLVDLKYKRIISIITGIDEIYMSEEWLTNRSNFKTLSKSIDFILPRFALYLSTIISLLTSIEEGQNSLVLFEDDAVILQELEIPYIEDADIIYLGGTFSGGAETSDPIIKVKNPDLKVYGTYGYYIPNCKKILKILMSPFQVGYSKDKHPEWRTGAVKLRCQAIDLFYMNHLQKNGNCYIVNPSQITHPKNNKSTINKKIMNYVKLGLRFMF